MSNTVGIALTVALLIDAVANVARLVSVEIAYKRQAGLIKRQEIEVNRRVEAASSVVQEAARAAVLTTLAELEEYTRTTTPSEKKEGPAG